MGNELLKECMKRGFLLDRSIMDIFNELSEENGFALLDIILKINLKNKILSKKALEENLDLIKQSLLSSGSIDFISEFFEGQINVNNGNNNVEQVENINANNSRKKKSDIKIISSPAFIQRKIVVNDFIAHFRNRYEKIKGMLESKNLENLTSIRKIGKNKGNYTIIVSVLNKRITKNKNTLLDVEDMTGNCSVLINNSKDDLGKIGKSILPDDIVAINLTNSGSFMFVDDVLYPESGISKKNKIDEDIWVAFTGDLHVGSKMFLEKNFLKFTEWLNGNNGTEEQKELAKKVKYLFFVGDNIDGVSHYPGQEKYLDLKTSVEQYKRVEELIRLIRNDLDIIMCPGQHDSVWVGEPQPIIGEEFAKGLYKIPNLHLVPNPSLVKIKNSFNILMYHGASINYFIDEIPEIRSKYKHNNPTRVVQEMLKRRHLAPLHGLADYIPCEEDSLVIDQSPDIVLTGDQHRSEVSTRNNILLVASSCWQSITPFEEKVGNNPDPCKVPLFNLKTREIKILDFSLDSEEILEENKIEDELDNFENIKEAKK
ncbi:hypothetical protein HN865_02100 [Candidatus Woesearchaeota archaeon]|nr:hypothetical protein [Candidatus Woesearchaeota archaeon]